MKPLLAWLIASALDCLVAALGLAGGRAVELWWPTAGAKLIKAVGPCLGRGAALCRLVPVG